MKKIIVSVLLIICMCGCTNETLPKLPQPELSEGQRGQLGQKQFNNYILSKQEEKNNLVNLINKISHSKVIIAEYDCNQNITKNENYNQILFKNDVESNIKSIKEIIK